MTGTASRDAVAGSRPLLIVNPRAGGGKTAAAFPAMRGAIAAALGPVDVVMTERGGHGIDLAEAAVRSGRSLVVAVGGDGTFHEVVNGVMNAGEGSGAAHAETRTRVGMIGQGTGGDFARTLGIAHRLDAYLAALASGRERAIDVGRLRYAAGGLTRTRFFVNILSAGMSGLVDRYVADASRGLGGTAAYFGASVKALVRCKPGRVRATVTSADGGGTGAAQRGEPVTVERRAWPYLIAICNGQYFGAGMHVAPMAKVDDGRFEVISMSAPSKLAFAMTARKIYKGAHLGAPGVEHYGCQKIALDLEDESARAVFLLDVDGEALGGLPIEVELVPSAIRLRA